MEELERTEEKNRFVSHIAEDGREEAIVTHLREVSEMAGEFARPFGAENWASAVGMAHDVGKYSQEFQNRIMRNGHRVDHSTAGASLLYEAASCAGTCADRLLAYCVAGHHGGLPDGGSGVDNCDASTLMGRMARAREHGIPDFGAYASEVAIGHPTPPTVKPISNASKNWAYSLSFLTRMVFSCLVDADFLCTERFMNGKGREPLTAEGLDILLDRLEAKIAEFYPPQTSLNETRCSILDACKDAASLPPGFFSLTVPTGGGKTYVSLRFALSHALAVGHAMRRVIYVIPYTSIIEQNAAVFREVLGDCNVLEHHSNFDFDFNDEDRSDSDWRLKNAQRLAAENWDAPVVLTTNVQLFESLYANRTSRCRKLHNIANSVIVLDEAQMIPTKQLRPCLRALIELVANYGCSVVLCTATQPALDNMIREECDLPVREIAPNSRELFAKLQRVTYRFDGKLEDADLAAQLSACKQALCIVNSRRQAKALFDLVSGAAAGADAFHLTTLMHPVHRERVLREIRRRLAGDEPCVVVATSLIEAGVDVDFPVVYRSLAGVDSMVQAAGRCNREGNHSAQESVVHLFEPEDGYGLPSDTKQKAAIARGVLGDLAERGGCDIGSLEAIEAYFTQLYRVRGEGLDSADVLGRLDFNMKSMSVPFKGVADAFRMIEDGSVPVIVPDSDIAAELDSLRRGFADRAIMRRLSRRSVGVYERDLSTLLRTGKVEAVADGIYVLADETCYTGETGLNLDVEEGAGVYW